MPQTQTPGLQPPLQTRSQATLDRIVAATTRLLETRTWAEVGVVEIARVANSSVGALYARFRDKDAILEYLDERYAEEMVAVINHLADGSYTDLEDVVGQVTRLLLTFHRKRRGLIRALVLRARARRDPAWDDRTQRINTQVARVVRLMASRAHAIPGVDPERRLTYAFAFLLSAMRDRILFAESMPMPRDANDQELGDELARAMLAYLRAPAP